MSKCVNKSDSCTPDTENPLHIKIGIPLGDYCYEVIEILPDATHKIRYCPFWYGTRPNGGCLVYGWDVALGDACKSCGWRQPEYLFPDD